jgi:cytochrome c oxidase assembly protein subunit 15
VSQGDPVTSSWPRRFAWALLLASIPLILFGGTVTTMRAGLAEDGWLQPDGYLLWLYPLEMRLRNAGVFVEHHHREIGSLVGMLAIALVVATWIGDKRRSARLLAVGTLLAICVQGAIGGFRVLEANPDLAFLHGALAHAVFALIGANTVVASRTWIAAQRGRVAGPAAGPTGGEVDLRRATALALAAVYGQIVAGAWLRHSGENLALLVHLILAAAALVAVLAAAAGMARAEGSEGGPEGGVLARGARRLKTLLALQLGLGVASAIGVYGFSGGFEAEISGFELVASTLHVLFGALLLLQTSNAALWVRRLAADEAHLAVAPSALAGGTRS